MRHPEMTNEGVSLARNRRAPSSFGPTHRSVLEQTDITVGNQPVKAMAETLDIVKIAVCDQIRSRRIPKRPDLVHQASPD